MPSRNKNGIRSTEDITVDIVIYIITFIFLIVTLVPLLNVASKAFSDEKAIISNSITIYPKGFQLHTMKYVLNSDLFRLSFKNSFIVTVLGTLLSVFVTALAAFPLSKRNLPFHKGIMLFFVFTMWFSGGMVPTYLIMRQLKLTNTLAVLILPGAINVYNMLLIKNYYESLPASLEESARIDGARSITVFLLIIAPLSLPILATVCLFTAVGLWNDYFSAMIYNTQSSLKTLPLYLRDIIAEAQTDTSMVKLDDQNILPEGVRAATIVASTVPILIVYPFLQKYFIKGILIGSVKE